jgi:hypothetical protein
MQYLYGNRDKMLQISELLDAVDFNQWLSRFTIITGLVDEQSYDKKVRFI